MSARIAVASLLLALVGCGSPTSPDGGSSGGGTATTGGGSTGSTGGGSTAGGAAGGASTAGGFAGGSTAGGSAGGDSTAGGSTAGGSTAGGSTAGGGVVDAGFPGTPTIITFEPPVWSSSSTENIPRGLALDRQGRPVVLVYADAGLDLVTLLEDGGVSTEQITQFGGPPASNYQFGIDPSGTRHILAGSVYFRVPLTDGGFFTYSYASPNIGGSTVARRLAVSPDGTAHIITHVTTADGGQQLFTIASPPGAVRFDAGAPLNGTGRFSTTNLVHAFAPSAGVLEVAYQTDASPTRLEWSRRVGNTWQPNTVIAPNTGRLVTSAGFDGGLVLLVAPLASSSYTVWSHADAGPWSSIGPFTGPAPVSMVPDSRGNVWLGGAVPFQSRSVSIGRHDGTTYVSSEFVPNDAGANPYGAPFVAMGPGDRLHFVFAETNGSSRAFRVFWVRWQ